MAPKSKHEHQWVMVDAYFSRADGRLTVTWACPCGKFRVTWGGSYDDRPDDLGA